MFNKRGQGLSINTIILLILGIVVLVVLALGFVLGWDKVLPWVSANNVDTTVNQCQAACSTSSIYGFCGMERSLKSSDLPGGKKEVKGNCSYFSANQDYTKYGIAACPGLCPVESSSGQLPNGETPAVSK